MTDEASDVTDFRSAKGREENRRKRYISQLSIHTEHFVLCVHTCLNVVITVTLGLYINSFFISAGLN